MKTLKVKMIENKDLLITALIISVLVFLASAAFAADAAALEIFNLTNTGIRG